MTIKYCTDKQEWEAVVQQSADYTHGVQFLQSWDWGVMQEAYGRTVHRYIVDLRGDIVLAVQLVRYALGKNKFYYFVPRGPLLLTHDQELLEQAHSALFHSAEFKTNAKADNVLFVRMEPAHNAYIHAVPTLKQTGDVSPAHSLLIDLHKKTEDDVLAGMKQKTRYNIRLAAKKEVRTQWVTSQASEEQITAAAEQFIRLTNQTAERHGIRPHAAEYYHTQIRELIANGVMRIGEAWHENDLLTSALFIQYGDTMTYLHGASANVKKNMMAPYAIQWAAIQHALEHSMRLYDFYGIAPEEAPNHKLRGVTRFKTGFGGMRVQYAGTYEFPISRLWYMIYRTVKRLRSGK